MRRRGISPVIATVILVAVAIAVAIAVAFWMTGIVGLFTGFEQLQITSAYAEGDEANGWTITVEVKNTGTAAASIDNIFINGKPISSYTGVTVSPDVTSATVSVNPGETKTFTITIQPKGTSGFSSGQSVEIKIHTAGGKEYPKLVVLP
ncbi:MAG: DUF4352 domain-containing protein [Thermoprotei archaeon]|nr:MAG: DUF4352 domain-containing protein [Thermoprotei archaeon]